MTAGEKAGKPICLKCMRILDEHDTILCAKHHIETVREAKKERTRNIINLFMLGKEGQIDID